MDFTDMKTHLFNVINQPAFGHYRSLDAAALKWLTQ